jgi:hypothetical protein
VLIAAGQCSCVPAGYSFSYWHTKKADERKAKIERVNEQLRDLYGPLLACVTATQSAYRAMMESAVLHLKVDEPKADLFRQAVTTDPHGPIATSYRYGRLHLCAWRFVSVRAWRSQVKPVY